MPKERPQHFIITRHGIGIRDIGWYEQRLGLFASVTLPSLVVQERPGLYWLIVIDSKIPFASLSALQKLTAKYKFIHLVPIDCFAMPRMVQGGFDWIWQYLQRYLLRLGIIEDVFRPIITSIIDDDDAWHQEVISRIDTHVSEYSQLMITKRGYLVRHSAGILMTFRHGLIWDTSTGFYRTIDYLAHSMSVFVYARFSSNISACTARHASWPNFIHTVGFEMHTIRDDDPTPMWIYLRHDHVLSEHRGAEGGEVVNRAKMDWFGINFGIDIPAALLAIGRLQERIKFTQDGIDQCRYSMLDLQFRINALQHQCQSLDEGLQRIDLTSSQLTHLRTLRDWAGRQLGEAITQAEHIAES